MAKKYKGSLSLEWFNKQKSIVNLDENSIKSQNDIPAPRVNWINKEEALFYELNKEEGKGNIPYWVNRGDIRVKEARPLVFQKAFKSKKHNNHYSIEEISSEKDSTDIENMLIKGDNLLALNTLKKHFNKLPESEKVKCIFIDPPYNTEAAFEHYDDNLEHSEWLTLMRDRLVKLKSLLSEDGSIWITVDDKEAHYLKILLDDVFGRQNFVANIVWEKVYSPRMDATGFSISHDHILVYSKSSSFTVNRIVAKQNAKQFSKFDSKIGMYYRPRTLRKEGSNSLRSDRPKLYYPLIAPDNSEVYPIRPDGREGCWRWELPTYEKRKEKDIEWVQKDDKWEVIVKQWKEKDPTKPPSTYWDLKETQDESTLGHLLYNWLKKQKKLDKILKDFGANNHSHNIFRSNEVGHNHEAKEEVKTINSDDVFDTPKPERLIKNILEIASQEGDLILDCFGGSGTTFAVAHKMNRKWIGIEIGNHSDTHIIPRLKGVMDGSDKIGITKSENWKGGGSFKYYHLGESIISVDEETKKGEFNWIFGKEFIQESLLQSYDFVVQENIHLNSNKIFEIEGTKPTIGKLIGSSEKSIYGLAFLAEPGDEDLTITNEQVKYFYNSLKKDSDFHSMVIYTNKGIDIAQDAIPADLDIIKVPHAIFSELER